MKKTINRYEFIEDMFSYYDGNGFSYEGLSVLFDYLEAQDTGEEMEFDAVALHCQFSEYNVIDFINDYYDNEDIEAILSANRLESIEEITADILEEYEWADGDNRIISIIDDNKIIVDTER